MAAMANMMIEFDPEAKAAIEALTDQVKALRDLLETKAGTEVHNHYHYNQPSNPVPYWQQPYITYTNKVQGA